MLSESGEKVLVTGEEGFVGSHLVALVGENTRARVVITRRTAS